MNRMKREGLATCTLLVLFCRGSGVLSSEDAGRQFPQKGSAGRGNLTHGETEKSPDMEHFAGSFDMPMCSNKSRGSFNLSNEATVLLEESANEDRKHELDALGAQMDALDEKIREIHELETPEPSEWAVEQINKQIPEQISQLTQEINRTHDEELKAQQHEELEALIVQLQAEAQGARAIRTLSFDLQAEILSEHRTRLEELKELKEHLKDLKEHLKVLPLETQIRFETQMRLARLLEDFSPQIERSLERLALERLALEGLALEGCSLPKSFGRRKGIANLMQIVAPLAMSIILITAFFERILAERKRRASKQRIAGKA